MDKFLITLVDENSIDFDVFELHSTKPSITSTDNLMLCEHPANSSLLNNTNNYHEYADRQCYNDYAGQLYYLDFNGDALSPAEIMRWASEEVKIEIDRYADAHGMVYVHPSGDAYAGYFSKLMQEKNKTITKNQNL